MKRVLQFGDTTFSCLPDFSGPVEVHRDRRTVTLAHVGAMRDLLAESTGSSTELIALGRGAVFLPACDLRDFLSVVDPAGPSLPSAPQGYEPTCEMRWAPADDPGPGVLADEFGNRWRLEQRWRQSEIPGIRHLCDCAGAWVPVRAITR